MRRIELFAAIFAVALGAFLVLLVVSVYLANTMPAGQSSWTDQMWGSMGMGGMMNSSGNYASPSPSYLWLIPAGLIGVAVFGAIGLAFYLAFPEIRPTIEYHSIATGGESLPAVGNLGPATDAYETISKTLTPEERKVLDILMAHEGRYLQKYVRKEAGLSRLKTHRIVARFAQRGIVTVKQSGNTNEILVSDWLQRPKPQPKSQSG